MTLAEYLRNHNITQADFGARINRSQAHVSRLVSGETPSLEVAVQIERETGGAVPAVSWVPLEPSECVHQSSPSPSPENAGGV